jgi:hypothetical protein
VNWYNNAPSNDQAILPYSKYDSACGPQTVMFHLLLASVMLEFDHYLVIYTFATAISSSND